jgi:DNA-binding response OmpR family regulator
MTQPRRILLVEDHKDTAVVVRFILEQRGYAVTHAASCDEASRCVASDPVDLLICDIGLPDGSGLDLVRRIQLDCSIPAIAVSGFGTEEDVRRSLDAGFQSHLTKPFDIQSLLSAIERALP